MEVSSAASRSLPDGTVHEIAELPPERMIAAAVASRALRASIDR
jgi:hypothetical protein